MVFHIDTSGQQKLVGTLVADPRMDPAVVVKLPEPFQGLDGLLQAPELVALADGPLYDAVIGLRRQPGRYVRSAQEWRAW